MKRSISQGVILTTLLFMVFFGLYVSTPASAADKSDVEEFVTRFYELCLGRSPDSGGLDGWVSALMDGSNTGSAVADGFVFSQEFLNKNTTNEEYLQVLYEAFFNRQPDPIGMQGWLDAFANGSSRKDVLNGFIYATEFNNLCWEYGISPNPIAAFVTRFYQLCLNRSPDRAGLDGWTNELRSETKTGADVANGFIYSQEFINKNTTNDGYLTILYKAFFNRDPDQAGWDVWLSELNAGKNRGEVLDGFIKSAEFSNLCYEYGINPFGVCVVFKDIFLPDEDSTQYFSCEYESQPFEYKRIISRDSYPNYVDETLICESLFYDETLIKSRYFDFDVDGKFLYYGTFYYDYFGGGSEFWLPSLQPVVVLPKIVCTNKTYSYVYTEIDYELDGTHYISDRDEIKGEISFHKENITVPAGEYDYVMTVEESSRDLNGGKPGAKSYVYYLVEGIGVVKFVEDGNTTCELNK